MGRAEAVVRQAGPAITTLPYTKGTIFVAGSAPEIGDTEQGLVPQAYVALGRALKPLRAEYPDTISTSRPATRRHPATGRGSAGAWPNRMNWRQRTMRSAGWRGSTGGDAAADAA